MKNESSFHLHEYEEQAINNMLALKYIKPYRPRNIVLGKIYKAFTDAGIKWTFACSFGLFLKGIVDDFHDFDVLVPPEDFPKLCKALDKIENKKRCNAPPPKNQYFYDNEFARYQIDGIGIDVICEFGFATFDTLYQHHFDEHQIEKISFMDMELPCIAPEAQFIFYGMMTGWQPQRAFKRNLIANYLKNGNLNHEEILEQAIVDGNLPPHLLYQISLVLKGNQ